MHWTGGNNLRCFGSKFFASTQSDSYFLELVLPQCLVIFTKGTRTLAVSCWASFSSAFLQEALCRQDCLVGHIGGTALQEAFWSLGFLQSTPSCAVGSSSQRQRHAEPATRNLGAIVNKTHYINGRSSVIWVSYCFIKTDGMAAVQHRSAELAVKI